MRKKNTVVVLIALVVLVGFGMYYFKPYLLPINSGVVWSENVVSEREQILLDFVNDKLTDEKGGIKTNYTEFRWRYYKRKLCLIRIRGANAYILFT